MRFGSVTGWTIRALRGLRLKGSHPTCSLHNPHLCIITVSRESCSPCSPGIRQVCSGEDEQELTLCRSGFDENKLRSHWLMIKSCKKFNLIVFFNQSVPVTSGFCLCVSSLVSISLLCALVSADLSLSLVQVRQTRPQLNRSMSLLTSLSHLPLNHFDSTEELCVRVCVGALWECGSSFCLDMC